jgi:hypothetical protein
MTRPTILKADGGVALPHLHKGGGCLFRPHQPSVNKMRLYTQIIPNPSSLLKGSLLGKAGASLYAGMFGYGYLTHHRGF